MAIALFLYGRWDATAQAHRAAEESRWNAAAAEVFGTEGAFDAGAARAALAALEVLEVPVPVLAGEFDPAAAPRMVERFAELFARAEFVVQP